MGVGQFYEKSTRPKIVLVTGSAGMIGSELATKLSLQGRKVIGFDINQPSPNTVLYETVKGDLTDRQGISKLFKKYSFDGIIHCGGISGPMVKPKDPATVCAINIDATISLLEAARRQKIARFVYCSSISAYGGVAPNIVSEEGSFRPTDVYGATKAACDALVNAYRVEHALSGVALRIGRVYGPGRTTESFIATLISDALEKISSRPPGDGTTRYHYIYRDDVISALILALDASCEILSAYNIAGNDIASDLEVANIIQTYLPNADIVFGLPEDNIITKRPFLDISAAQRDLHYLPKFDLNSGIRAYIEWMKNQ
jgi:UDP-glucuronate 4-epimerase